MHNPYLASTIERIILSQGPAAPRTPKARAAILRDLLDQGCGTDAMLKRWWNELAEYHGCEWIPTDPRTPEFWEDQRSPK